MPTREKFISRGFDQIEMAAVTNANIKICGSHAGLQTGPDGATHQALEDLALMRGRTRRLGSQEFFNGHPELTGSQCANHGGFSLHAGVYCFPGNRTQLEQVIRYVFRPAIAEGRLSLGPNDQIIYRLKRAYTDGTTHLLFSGVEFLEKIAALVPPHSKTRAQIVPKPETEKPDTQTTATTPEKSDDTKAKQRRIFQIDVTKCDACGGEMKIIAAILEKEVIHKILGHLDLPTQPPDLAPARLPSQMSFA